MRLTEELKREIEVFVSHGLGAKAIARLLAFRHGRAPSPSTIQRYLTRRGLRAKKGVGRRRG